MSDLENQLQNQLQEFNKWIQNEEDEDAYRSKYYDLMNCGHIDDDIEDERKLRDGNDI